MLLLEVMEDHASEAFKQAAHTRAMAEVLMRQASAMMEAAKAASAKAPDADMS